jgi:hypothetical protein
MRLGKRLCASSGEDKLPPYKLKLLGTVALVSVAASTNANERVDISHQKTGALSVPGVEEVFENLDFDLSEALAMHGSYRRTKPKLQNINISATAIDNTSPINSNIALQTGLAAVIGIETAALQLNSIATNTGDVDGWMNISVRGDAAQTGAVENAFSSSQAGSTALNSSGEVAAVRTISQQIEASDGDSLSGLQNAETDIFASNGAIAASNMSQRNSQHFQTRSESNTLDEAVWLLGDIRTMGLGANNISNSTDVAFVGNIASYRVDSAKASNSEMSSDIFNIGGIGVNAIATNTGKINASLTASFSTANVVVGDVASVATGAINTVRLSGAISVIK